MHMFVMSKVFHVARVERCKSHNIFLPPEENLFVEVEYEEARFSY